MIVDRDELLKEIERCEYEKPRLVVWTQMDEFRLQCMKDLAAANKKIEQLSAPVSDEEHDKYFNEGSSQHGWTAFCPDVDKMIAARKAAQ